MSRSFSRRVYAFAAAWLVVTAAGALSFLHGQPAMKEYWDKEYNFGFQYPPSWKLKPFPEGQAKRDLRAVVDAPAGGSLMVVIEKLEKPTRSAGFEAPADRKTAVQEIARQTIEEIYRTISTNIRASSMTVGEVRDISSRAAIKYYIATLHRIAKGRPMIVAGIHALPYDKAYRIDFIMTSPWNEAAKTENEAMMIAFNSFYLLGESDRAESNGGKPPQPTR